MKKFLEKIFVGDVNAKYIKSLQPIVDRINDLEGEIHELSDEQLRDKTREFKDRLKGSETLDDLLPEAFACVREAAKRTLGQRHYDVQLIGGIILHRGQITEMRTGEGKTLVATLPLYLNALEGKGAHLVTVNEYLAKVGVEWMGQVYHLLGLSVGVIQHDVSYIYTEDQTNEDEDEIRDRGVEIEQSFLKEVPKQQAYAADITYGTNNEFGFDYLRDNMVQDKERMVQRDLHFAIVDEVDSILIDEARTPLIISAPDMESTDKYYQYAKIVQTLISEQDYNVDEKRKAAILTPHGIAKVEKALGVENLYVQSSISTVHHIESALRAKALFNRDTEYVVRDGEVVIVDEFTGRMLPGRRYSQGLHQAIEAKEGVKIQRESKTMATITFQNYFRLYSKLSGMTGTAYTEAEEFRKIYGLDVTVIPTNKPIQRKDYTDKIYSTEQAKFKAVVNDIKKLHEKGQPVLVGTVSIEKNELLSEMLTREGVPHQMLNAKNHEREAAIIAQAGKAGGVTIATNMAGRGVDIILGGNPEENEGDHQRVLDLGGLYVIGTERHDSRRIDNQLRGRSGRQGDPGESQFYVSMDDNIARVFGSDRMKNVMKSLGLPEDVPIQNKIVSRSLEEAQKRVETYNYDARKHVVEYDDVLNKQRTVIYDKRREILFDAQKDPQITKNRVLEMVNNEINEIVTFHIQSNSEKGWNLKAIYEAVHNMFTFSENRELDKEQIEALPKETGDAPAQRLVNYLVELAKTVYDEVEKTVVDATGDEQAFRKIEKQIMLRTIDTLWVEHLDTMDSLRTSIGLRGYGQRDPLVEYKKESFRLFNMLLGDIQNQVVYSIYKVKRQLEEQASLLQRAGLSFSAPAKTQINGGNMGGGVQTSGLSKVKKVGRNDLCPCGSGKKYKKCHGE